ncbi:hypothetical protein RND71_038358 [Anisodus tanguticus]|uniref:Omega-3 fatty acid desaturase n=1 Tax=Anisodus tanguticus TaxID=243964 RepID=A0AAE1R2H9_9SOLA|nr:hypothetical protein RND71_038358 [Anisodus tanguticus]
MGLGISEIDYKSSNDIEFEFDPSAPPPFRLADIRIAIPKHCWVKDPFRSLSYVFRDLALIATFIATAIYLDTWLFYPIYWAIQGTIFWAIFVLGHDCGHGSFSDNLLLNNVVGHILHSVILVPYHGWRISHKTHHQNHGNVETDESWVPMPEKLYKKMDYSSKILRYKIPFPLLAYPMYLMKRSPGKSGSHFNPYSDLFQPNERNYIVTSTVCWTIMAAILVYLCTVFGTLLMFKIYGVPYLIFVMWLDFVTYLHHHGYEKKLPWYRGKTKAAKLVLGKYYREPKQSGPIPFHLIKDLSRSMKQDHYVSDYGEIVFYQTDPHLFPSSSPKEE